MKQSIDRPDNLSEAMIDQALSTYAAHPLSGLESRVLSVVAANSHPTSAQQRPAVLWFWSLSAFAAITLVALTLGIWTLVRTPASSTEITHNGPFTQQTKAQRHNQQQEATAKAEATRTSLTPTRKPAVHRPVPFTVLTLTAVKPNQPTEQESLLAKVAAQGSGKALVIPGPQTISLKPLENNPIQIQPLSIRPIFIAPIRIAALQPLPITTP